MSIIYQSHSKNRSLKVWWIRPISLFHLSTWINGGVFWGQIIKVWWLLWREICTWWQSFEENHELSIHYMSDPTLITLNGLSPLIFIKTLWGKYHYPHFTDEEMEPERGWTTCSRTEEPVLVPRDSVTYTRMELWKVLESPPPPKFSSGMGEGNHS